jgi:hypothetical protein
VSCHQSRRCEPSFCSALLTAALCVCTARVLARSRDCFPLSAFRAHSRRWRWSGKIRARKHKAQRPWADVAGCMHNFGLYAYIRGSGLRPRRLWHVAVWQVVAGGSAERGPGQHTTNSHPTYPGCVLAREHRTQQEKAKKTSSRFGHSELSQASFAHKQSFPLATSLTVVPSVLHAMVPRRVACEFPGNVVLRSRYSQKNPTPPTQGPPHHHTTTQRTSHPARTPAISDRLWRPAAILI